jgi:hypothetical protein
VHHSKNFQYTPAKNGKGILKMTLTVNTDSPLETIQALAAAGYPGMDPNLGFKQCLAKGEHQIIPQIPLMNQIG